MEVKVSPLFYILIAVLGAFALVSLLNYVRTRRRRLIILAEAERLGLMVPGMEGYVPMRERPALRKLDGWRTPDWWEVLEKQTQKRSSGGGAGVGHANGDASAGESKGKTKVAVGEDSTTASRRSSVYEDTFESPQQPPISTEAQSTTPLTSSTRPPASAAAPTIAVTDADPDFGARGELEVTSMEDLRPLALIPVPQLVSEPVKPLSPIPYFPNYVSYLKTAHDPKPPRFAPDDPDAFNCIIGEPLDVVVAVRMPRPPTQRDTPHLRSKALLSSSADRIR